MTTENKLWLPSSAVKDRRLQETLGKKDLNSKKDLNNGLLLTIPAKKEPLREREAAGNNAHWVSTNPQEEEEEEEEQRPVVKKKRKKLSLKERLKRMRVLIALRGAVRRVKEQCAAAVRGKTLWNWVAMLLPFLGAVLVAAAIYIGMNRMMIQQTKTQEELAAQTTVVQEQLAAQSIAEQEKFLKQFTLSQTNLVKQQSSLVDEGHEQILAEYLNSMSNLISSKGAGLHSNTPNTPEKVIAQTKTVAVLSALQTDAVRQAVVVQFLHDANLITVGHPVVNLSGVNLSGISLKQANLASTDFDGAIMSGANMTGATLTSSTFRGTTLTKAVFSTATMTNADLTAANLENVDFTNANMKGANVSGADVKNAKLKGSTW